MPKSKNKIGLIEDETLLMPWIIADSVIHELEAYLSRTDPHRFSGLRGPYAADDLADTLSDKANRIYQVNPYFRKKIRAQGNSGRDYLYTFMRHWLAAECKDRGVSGVPLSFANGLPL